MESKFPCPVPWTVDAYRSLPATDPATPALCFNRKDLHMDDLDLRRGFLAIVTLDDSDSIRATCFLPDQLMNAFSNQDRVYGWVTVPPRRNPAWPGLADLPTHAYSVPTTDLWITSDGVEMCKTFNTLVAVRRDPMGIRNEYGFDPSSANVHVMRYDLVPIHRSTLLSKSKLDVFDLFLFSPSPDDYNPLAIPGRPPR